MRLRRKSVEPARRQRVRSEAPAPATFAYHARRSARETNEPRNSPDTAALPARLPRTKWPFTRGRTFLLALVALLVIFYGLSLSTTPSIQVLNDAGVSLPLVSPAAYRQAAHNALASSWLNLNKITINTKQVQNTLLKQFPELGAATVTVPFVGRQPSVYVAPAQPVLILAANNGQFVIDNRGKALIMTANLPTSTHLTLPTVTDQSNVPVSLNKQALTAQSVSFIQVVLGQLTAKHQDYANLSLPASASELDVHLKGLPYFIKFNMQSDRAREQVGTFFAAQAELTSQHITPTQYIDVRVEGRAYYQ